MTGSVRYTDGIRIDLATGETVAADSEYVNGEINVLSHAHGDHLYRSAPGDMVCSELTAALANVRRDDTEPLNPTSHPAVELVSAGHVAGSTAAVVDDAERTYCYTGDISTRDRFYLDGFRPPNADVLIIESTYGKPEYVFAPQDEIERELVDWLDDTYETPAILFGYSLGRAQKLQLLAQRSDRSRLFVTKAVERINAVIEDHLDVSFDASRFSREVELGAGDVLVLPTQTSRLAFVDDIVEETGALKVGASGWAVDRSFRFRGDYDETFVLSDHCDFDELVRVVEQAGPEQVYTNHGFADEFADYLAAELDYDARSLKRNQLSLGDF
ncbi:MBL fold metallo-hydrolase RNA specificity domain-containing protein [Haloprofundus salilacus]|uniref:MBL fold metallo-hydrolase RNA specificity domain-containing protein n=1 Tax=Haloprofundus salilacus TaxID=2876190 RepID=UPI001CCF697C|nr:MBL fold metallo-hydrolase RNA specificity domain-containing protein [Haloprofundus salilacus]